MSDTTATALTPLERLHAQAALRGWQPDEGRRARPHCWISPDSDAEFTVQPAGDLRITVINAHTAEDSLKVTVTGPERVGRAIGLLVAFLGWHDTNSEATS